MRFRTFFNTILSQFIHPQNIAVIIKLCKLKCRCIQLCPESSRPNTICFTCSPPPPPAELLLSRETRRTLAQLRTNKSPLLVSYLFSIGDRRHPLQLCPLCLMHDHTSSHLFECKSLPTSLSSLDLWTNPDKVEPFLATWAERLLAAT